MSSSPKIHLKLISLVLLVFLQTSLSKRYDDYKMYRAIPATQGELSFFTRLQLNKSMDIDFWTEPGSLYHAIDMVVPPHRQPLFLAKANFLGIRVTQLLKNVQEAFAQQKVRPYTRRNLKSFGWENYYTLEDIYEWLKDLITDRHNQSMKLINIGKSAEGRDILGVYFKCQGYFCKSIFIEGGIHAREWISHAFVTYLISELANARTNEIIYALIKYNWHIFPVVNPDGYVYTHNRDQGWRKNRRYLGNGAYGVDLNRNFDYKFGSIGESQDRYSSSYCGPVAFSEPETKAIADYMKRSVDQLDFYLSFHSYGQCLIIPYGDDKIHRDNFDDVKRLGQNALQRLKSFYGTTYKIGTGYEVLGYKFSGNSVDWVKSNFNVAVAVNFELRDDGKYGFALPAKYILPTCIETMAGVLTMLNKSNALNLSSIFTSRKSSALKPRVQLFVIFGLFVTLITIFNHCSF